MSRSANSFRHGATHVSGGSDPIPGLGGCCPPDTVCTPFPDKVADVAAGYPADSLLGYWRLGDGASPFLDSSGHSGGAANQVKTTTGTAMTDSVAGALPAADDDGAVQFNNSTGAAGDYLRATDPPPYRFDGAGVGNWTVSAWVNPAASASTFKGQVAGAWGSYFLSEAGWRLYLNWPGRTPSFTRRVNGGSPVTVTGPALTAGEWAFLAATYDPTNGHLLYINGALMATTATILSGLDTGHLGVWIGRGGGGAFGTVDSFYGGIDEVTVWGVALTPTEISELYVSGGPCAGADAGKVITSVGDGTTEWAYPTVAVDGARYDSIVAGAGLGSSGATDATLAVNVDGSTLEVASDTVRVKAGGITPTELASTAVSAGSYGDATHVAQFTVDADGRLTAAASVAVTGAGGASPTDTAGWMPLTTVLGGVPDLVWDASDSLIPTYTPF